MPILRRFSSLQSARRWSRGWIHSAGVILALTLAFLPDAALALITGGTGNEPVRDPGWPKGAAEVFNVTGRIAWWEGPPFGGGEWHAECRGDAKAFNEVLSQFAKIDATKKRLVIHDGEGRSFWINPNSEADKRADASMDWVFAVWQPEHWNRLQGLPADLRPRGQTGGGDAPVPQIDVYAGGRIRWADVKIPKGIEVVDQRLEAHGFTLADGTVLEGTVHDLGSGRPLKEVNVRLQRIEPQPKGGYQYKEVAATVADANGHWVLKSAPAGWHQVIAEAEGFAPRIVGYGTFDNQPRWQAFDAGLARAATVRGRVTDEAGKPLSDVNVRLGDVVAKGDGNYASPGENQVQTNAEGRFAFDQTPIGRATVWVHKPGYCRPGLGLAIDIPANDVNLSMSLAAALEVTVDFTGKTRPEGYIVEVAPEKGAVVGTWGGSGNINAEGLIAYQQIPPGKYVVYGRPNPGSQSQQTESVTVELRGGETTKLTLRAK